MTAMTREEQIELMRTAAARHDAAVRNWVENPAVKSALRSSHDQMMMLKAEKRKSVPSERGQK